MWILGLDYSTQQLKGIILDNYGNIIIEEKVSFDEELPQYKTTNGVLYLEDGRIVAPTVMWFESTDLLMEKLAKKTDLSQIGVISGTAQQHTSVYWLDNANQILTQLDSHSTLVQQIPACLAVQLSPTWMDSTTATEKSSLEAFMEGPDRFQRIIGSRLAERFTGLQIMKLLTNQNHLRQLVHRISLLSSAMCSLFVGAIVGIDQSDCTGTGLVSCGSDHWLSDLCQKIDPELERKLGTLIPSQKIVGRLNSYFVNKYGMDSSCEIVAFTGDNPSSVVGLQMNRGDLCLSMGTSDTLITCLEHIPHQLANNLPVFLFPHPINPSLYVSLLCYKNGSVLRSKICEELCKGDWSQFSEALKQINQRSKGRYMALVYDLPEITPSTAKVGRYFARITDQTEPSYEIVDGNSLSPTEIICSVVEGQFLSKYLHLQQMNSGNSCVYKRLIVTGGASANQQIIQMAANVFNMNVITIDTANSAALGAVIRAIYATQSDEFIEQFINSINKNVNITRPTDDAQIYQDILPTFDDFYNRYNSA